MTRCLLITGSRVRVPPGSPYNSLYRYRATITANAELLRAQTGIADNPTHGKSVHRIVAWNRDDANAVRHHNVPGLSCDSESRSNALTARR